MFNQFILDEIIAKFGIEDAIKYVRMETHKNQLLMNDFNKKFPNEANEYEYEYAWWKNKYKELTKEFITDVQENKFNLKEGVIAKGHEHKDIFMVKIKCKEWLNRVKNELGERALLEDIDNNIKHLIV